MTGIKVSTKEAVPFVLEQIKLCQVRISRGLDGLKENLFHNDLSDVLEYEPDSVKHVCDDIGYFGGECLKLAGLTKMVYDMDDNPDDFVCFKHELETGVAYEIKHKSQIRQDNMVI